MKGNKKTPSVPKYPEPSGEGVIAQRDSLGQLSVSPRISPNAAREAARVKLREAGLLVTDLEFPEDLPSATDDELEQLGVMRPGARPSEDLIAEDRGR